VKIVFAASEMRPLAETGGLGDFVGSLTRALQGLGHEVAVFLPFYRSIAQKGIPTHMIIDWLVYGDSEGDYEDNDRRFTFFCRAVLEALKRLRLSPDIVHSHDWQTGLIPAYLKTLYREEAIFKKSKSVFTIHNLAHQGNFPPDSFPLTGLSWQEYRFDRLEFWGKISFLKGGMTYSDLLTTVSGQYAKEIQTESYGCGMEEILKFRKKNLLGIVNGIDTEYWNPETDKELVHNFSSKDLEGKTRNKLALQKELGLDADSTAPLYGFVGRLSTQKGLDLILPLLDDFMKLHGQFVFLGTGNTLYEKMLKKAAQRNRTKMAVSIAYDPLVAKQIYASADIFLMPSLFEPCGLGQMIAMRYGTVPLVRATGGLKETVKDFDPKTQKGNGIVFTEPQDAALLKSIRRGAQLFQDKKTWGKIMGNCFKADFAWDSQAKKYVQAYQSLLKLSPTQRGMAQNKGKRSTRRTRKK